jgi:hypothetical protein
MRRIIMKRMLLASLLIVVVISLLVERAASRLADDEGPPGVDSQFWHPMTERLGLAVRIEPGFAGRREYIGTVMLKESEHWQPVYLEGPGPRLRSVHRCSKTRGGIDASARDGDPSALVSVMFLYCGVNRHRLADAQSVW